MHRIHRTPSARRLARATSFALPLVSALLGAAIAACGDGASPREGVQAASRADPTAPSAPAAPIGTHPAERELAGHAWDAFVAPLLDASDPNRFATRGVAARCGAGTRVTLDGRPLQDGRLMPRKAYTLRWTMVACRPFEGASTRLDGDVEVVVFPAQRQIGAMVMPRGLVLTTADARVPLTRVVEFARPRTADGTPTVAVR